jgi:hypothetical protein
VRRSARAALSLALASLSVGDSTKAFANPGSGGSYGYGKDALSLNPRLRTIVAHSAFEQDDTGATARLMGCAYLDAHEFDGKEWTIRDWFGIPRADHESDRLAPIASKPSGRWH